MKQAVQELYNKSQRIKWIRSVANYFMTRERIYQDCISNAVEQYLASVPRDAGGCIAVQEGLFSGMRYPEKSFVWSEFAPRIAGSYEMEVQAKLSQWLEARSFTSFVDIGAAEGHYVVGVGRLLTQIPIFAYEEKLEAHPVIRGMAELNSLQNELQLLGRFKSDGDLPRGTGSSPLVLVDIEGGESSLCSSKFVEVASGSCLLVEVHEFAAPGVGQRLAAAFGRTHKIERIELNPSLRKNLSLAKQLDAWSLDVVLDERRGDGIYWLAMEPV